MIVALALLVVASAGVAALLSSVLLSGSLVAKCASGALVLSASGLVILVANRNRWIMAILALVSLTLAGFWIYLLVAWPWTGAHATATRPQLAPYIAALALVSVLGFMGLGWKTIKHRPHGDA